MRLNCTQSRWTISTGRMRCCGVLAQGAEACNGWTFWHVETAKGLRLIDELRAEVRAEMAE